MALNCFQGDLLKWINGLCYATGPIGPVFFLFFLSFCTIDFFFSILSHPPSFVHVCSLFNVSYSGFSLSFSLLPYYFMLLCLVFYPLVHLQRLS